MLIQPVGVVAPGAGSRLQFRAGVVARHIRHAILALARIRGGSEVDVKVALWINREGMHRMIADQRQSRHDSLRRSSRLDPIRRQLVAHDAVVRLGIEVALVDGDAGSPRVAVRRGWAKADDLVGPAVAFGILQCNQ